MMRTDGLFLSRETAIDAALAQLRADGATAVLVGTAAHLDGLVTLDRLRAAAEAGDGSRAVGPLAAPIARRRRARPLPEWESCASAPWENPAASIRPGRDGKRYPCA